MRAIFLLAALAALPASAQPRLTFDAPRYDLGTFDEGEVATHVFRFANTGDALLVISEMIAACGCTTPEWTQEPVAPGDSGAVRVAYDSEGRPGPFEKTVRVVPRSGEAVTLRIVGNVVPVFVARGIRVGALTFARVTDEPGSIPETDRYQAVFRFQNTGARPVRIQAVDAPEGVETVFPSRPIFPGDVAAVLVNIENPMQVADGEALDADLAMVTDDAEQPVKTLRISATIGIR